MHRHFLFKSRTIILIYIYGLFSKKVRNCLGDETLDVLLKIIFKNTAKITSFLISKMSFSSYTAINCFSFQKYIFFIVLKVYLVVLVNFMWIIYTIIIRGFIVFIPKISGLLALLYTISFQIEVNFNRLWFIISFLLHNFFRGNLTVDSFFCSFFLHFNF